MYQVSGFKVASVIFMLSMILILVACSGDDASSDNAITLSDGSKMYTDKNISIPMRDGVRLSANIYRPARNGKFPVLGAMTPYDKDWLAVEYTPEDGVIEVSEHATFEQLDPDFWVANDYVVVSIDTRGSNLSEGELAVFTDQEAEDYYDAIEWLAVQGWSNGNIGLGGVSYMAVNQWKVAALNPPSLKAIMPWEGFTDLYRDAAYHGGIPEVEFLPIWWKYRVLENKNATAKDPNLPLQVANQPLLGKGDFYEKLTPQNLDRISVPAYVAASWPDHGLHTRGTLLGFENIGSENKWLEIHGRKKWEYFYSAETEFRQLQFFDYFLAEKNNGMLDVPRLRYELRSKYYEGETKTASDWPLPHTNIEELYLDAENGTLNTNVPNNSKEVSYFADKNADPELIGKSQQATFRHTFSIATEITGGMNLILWVSVDGANDTDFFVGVQKLDSDGKPVYFEGNREENGLVANGWLRASHRALDKDKSTPITPFHLHTKEEKLSANDIVPVEIEILPSSTYFNALETIEIIIQGVDLKNSGVVHESISEGKVTIYTGEQYPSRIAFPVNVN